MEEEKSGAMYDAKTTNESEYAAIDKIQQVLSEKLRKAASAVGERATVSEATGGGACYEKLAAELLNVSADCVEKFDYRQTMEQARGYIRENPGSSLIMAAEAGFLIGAILKRR